MWLYVERHVPSFSTLENISKQNWKMDEGRPENDVKKLMTRRHLHKTKKVPTWLYYVPGVNLMTLVPKTGHEKRNLLSWWVSTQQALAMASLTLYPAPTLLLQAASWPVSRAMFPPLSPRQSGTLPQPHHSTRQKLGSSSQDHCITRFGHTHSNRLLQVSPPGSCLCRFLCFSCSSPETAPGSPPSLPL